MMTTAENIRRRQRRVGAIVLVLGLATFGEGVYFQHQQTEQRDCFEEKFSELTSTLKIRGSLTTQQLAQITALIDGALASQTPEEFLSIKKAYKKAGERIARARQRNPIREYPTGFCDNGSPTKKHKGAGLPWTPYTL